MIKRILIISLCVSALLTALVLPASAAELDYNDYITNIQVDGDNDIVTVKFPLDPEISLYSNNPFVLQYQTDTARLEFDVTAGVSYSLGLYAFRDDFLILDNIPDGSLFTLTYEFTPVVGSVTKPVSIMSRNYFYGPNGSYLGEHRIYSDEFGLQDQTFQFSYNKLSGASYGKFEFYWDGITFEESGSKSFTFRDFTIVMSISSLYRLQQETGKTNEILSAVEKQLAEQGKTLDEVLGAQQETNEKLEDIISGGSGAEDLMASGDKIENAGSGLGTDIGKIEDFEKEFMGQLENNLDDVYLNPILLPSSR